MHLSENTFHNPTDYSGEGQREREKEGRMRRRRREAERRRGRKKRIEGGKDEGRMKRG